MNSCRREVLDLDNCRGTSWYEATNKAREDAVHFNVGFKRQPRDVATSRSRGASNRSSNTAKERRDYNPMWKFTRWDLVDLSRFTLKLKAEFQGSKRDMYHPKAIVATSAK